MHSTYVGESRESWNMHCFKSVDSCLCLLVVDFEFAFYTAGIDDALDNSTDRGRINRIARSSIRKIKAAATADAVTYSLSSLVHGQVSSQLQALDNLTHVHGPLP